jgi:hypothetical protein
MMGRMGRAVRGQFGLVLLNRKTRVGFSIKDSLGFVVSACLDRQVFISEEGGRA